MSTAIKTFWWRRQYPHRSNFGDEITAPLVERITGRPVTWAAPDACELVGAGSVIQMVLRRRGDNEPKFWGSGFIGAPGKGAGTVPLHLLAVRGTYSRGRVENTSETEPPLGDPGVLAPLLLNGPVKKRHALGVIPHYHDASDPALQRLRGFGPGVRIIDVGWSPEEVAREIASCDTVLSSSLHGLIFADGLGVPNLHFKMSDKLKGGTYKFRDYNSAVGGEDRYRTYTPPTGGAASLDDVVRTVEERYVPPTGLTAVQDGVARALKDL